MPSLASWFGQTSLPRLLTQRGMAAIYLVAFLTVLNQFKPLLGERGLLPVPDFTRRVPFRSAPSLFHWHYSDRLLTIVAWTGIVLSACALLGFTESGPIWISISAWLILWALYLSIMNVGQTFFSFGWESMLVEAGFFTAFLGPAHYRPSLIALLALRWMLFRTELGAGLIKLRHDKCWRDLTCLYYHYETQPLPNPLSWYFHRLPKFSHRFAVVISHFVQIVVPFALFAPQPYAAIAAGLIIFHQLWLIISGNYSWLNWLTLVLGFTGFSDLTLHYATPILLPQPFAFRIILYLLGAITIALSIQPTLNLFSRNQMMNYSYNPLHLVNTYGAFGSVGKHRYEIVIEGTTDSVITPATEWREYIFRAKPGDVKRTPPQIAPYHLRLDWLIWFLPFSVAVTPRGIHIRGYEVWFIRYIQRLLINDAATLSLMGKNPFPDAPPTHIRALFYEYHFTTWQQHRETGAWWTRKLLGTYLEAVSLSDINHVS